MGAQQLDEGGLARTWRAMKKDAYGCIFVLFI